MLLISPGLCHLCYLIRMPVNIGALGAEICVSCCIRHTGWPTARPLCGGYLRALGDWFVMVNGDWIRLKLIHLARCSSPISQHSEKPRVMSYSDVLSRTVYWYTDPVTEQISNVYAPIRSSVALPVGLKTYAFVTIQRSHIYIVICWTSLRWMWIEGWIGSMIFCRILVLCPNSDFHRILLGLWKPIWKDIKFSCFRYL